MKLKMDINGNKTLLCFYGGKNRRIQTNGNLPETHRNGIGPWTQQEILNYFQPGRDRIANP